MAKELKKFQIVGRYRKNKKYYDISQIITAQTKKYAIEKLYSLIGSRHRVKRNEIEILEVSEIE